MPTHYVLINLLMGRTHIIMKGGGRVITIESVCGQKVSHIESITIHSWWKVRLSRLFWSMIICRLQRGKKKWIPQANELLKTAGVSKRPFYYVAFHQRDVPCVTVDTGPASCFSACNIKSLAWHVRLLQTWAHSKERYLALWITYRSHP